MCASKEYCRERNWLAEQLFRSYEMHSRCITREKAGSLSLEEQGTKVKHDWYLVAQDAMELRGEYKRRLNARRNGLDVDTADACLGQIRQIAYQNREERDRLYRIHQGNPNSPFSFQE